MVPRWAVVDKLVHELGSLRAVMDEIDARSDLAQIDIALELRASLGLAADTIHLVVGGDDAMVAQAWRTIAEAQKVGARARAAINRAHATGERSRVLRDHAKAHASQTAKQVEELRAVGEATLTPSAMKGPATEHPHARPRSVPARPRPR